MWERLWIDANIATMQATDRPYGAIDGPAALAADKGRIVWLGRQADLPGRPESLAPEVIDCGGCWITPGLIDCHTHLVYAGNRSGEFEQRLKGASYADIATSGGGIMATVRATRAASPEALFDNAARRLRAMRDGGVTTVEIKSGYGLDMETELRMLSVARRLGAESGLRIRTSFLGAHALPPEFAGDSDGYIDFVCAGVLPAAHDAGLVDAVDAYAEGIAFSPAQIGRLFRRAGDFGLPVRLHADQLSDGGGAALAAEFMALSADHLDYTGDAGVAAMAGAGTVAVLLPAAFYYLRESHKPPVAALRRHRVPMAVASDCNPGSAPVTSLLLVMNMAAVLFGLSPEEALAGVTRHAARALGLAGECGALAPGMAADLALWDIDSPTDLTASIGHNPYAGVVVGGQPAQSSVA